MRVNLPSCLSMHLRARHFAVTLLATLALSLSACHGFFSDPILQSITVSPSSPIVGQGSTVQLTATGVNDDGSTASLNSVDWSSSDTSVATVDTSGMLKGVAAGTATITAKSGSVSGTATVNVTVANLSSISVTPANTTVAPGQQQQFTATGQLANGQTVDITKSVTWSSSNTSVATITSAGVATAQSGATGQTAEITATSNNLTGRAVLTVGIGF